MLNFSVFYKYHLKICSVSTVAVYGRRGRKQRQQQRKRKPQRKTIQRRRRCICPANTRRGYYLCLYLETRNWTYYSERQHSEVQYVSRNMRISKHAHAKIICFKVINSSHDNNPTYFWFFIPTKFWAILLKIWNYTVMRFLFTSPFTIENIQFFGLELKDSQCHSI